MFDYYHYSYNRFNKPQKTKDNFKNIQENLNYYVLTVGDTFSYINFDIDVKSSL